MSKSACTTKASFVYENTQANQSGERGCSRQRAVWNQGCRRSSLGLEGAWGGVWYLTAEGLQCLVMLMDRLEGARVETVFWGRRVVLT